MSPDWRAPTSCPSPRISNTRLAPTKRLAVVATIASSRSLAPLGSSSFAPRDEQAVRLLLAAPDPPAKLVQLREPEPVRPLDDHDRRVRDVDADLDHGRRDEDVELPVSKRGMTLPLLAGHSRPGTSRREAPQLAARSHSLVLGRARDVVRLFDQRADHVCLSALVDLRPRIARPPPRAPPVTHVVSMGLRSGGGIATREMSRSPYSVSASVRGIGVAVMSRTCGARPSRATRAA